MFNSRKSVTVAPVVPPDRLQAIVGAPAPRDYTAAGGVRKRMPRASVRKSATLRLADGAELPVMIRNLSLAGCRIEFSAPMQPSGRVLLSETSVPLELWAEVIWQGEGACGLAFEADELDLASMPHAALAQPKSPGASPQAPRPAKPRKSRSPLRKIP